MNKLHSLRRQATFLATMAAVFVCQAAEACPGCKNAVGGNGEGGNLGVNGEGVGYALSIGLLLFMVAAMLGTLGFFAYKNCQAIARAQQAALEAEERGLDDGAWTAGRA